MEISIKNERLPVCNAICRSKSTFTAECDVIVPDAKPDILKVLELSARTKVTGCETKNGRVSVTGTVLFNIIYLADNEEKCVKAITSSCEFSNVVHDESVIDTMLSFVDVDVSEIGCTLANCRKLTLRASLCMNLQVYSLNNIELISDIEGACTKTAKLSSSVICASAQSTSSLSDSFSLAAGKAPISELLKTDACITDSEIKVIDDKAVIKGNMRLMVLYKTESAIEYAQTEVPYAHILQADGIREDMDNEYCVKICDIDVSISEDSDGNCSIIDFTAEFFFRVIARCTYEASCVTDAFIPHNALECKYSTVCADSVENIIHRDVDIREKISLPDSLPPISTIYHIVARPFIESCHVDGDALKVCGYAEIYILYLSSDNDSPVYSHKTNIDFSTSCESMQCTITPISDCIMKNVSYTISSDSSIEVRASIDVRIQCVRTIEKQALQSAEIGEYSPKERPSIIVSYICSDRDLWDIAKEYCISPKSILAANALENEDSIPPHGALIIPK